MMPIRMDQSFTVTDTEPKIHVDSVKLVLEVKKYPMIYNTWLRRNQFTLCAAWELVIAALVPHYNMMHDMKKSMIRRQIRARWSWMRSTLRRDLSRNRMQCHLHLNWMREMQFLVPLMLNRLEENAARNRQRSGNVSDSATVTSTTAPSSLVMFGSSASPSTLQANDPNETIVKAFISTFSSEVNASSADTDKNFLITLLHVFRKVRPDQKAILRQKFFTYFNH